MKPLTMPERFALHTPAEFSTRTFSPLRRYALPFAPGNLWYPALLTPACAATPASSPPSEFTLGSLVDGKSNLLSPPDHKAGFAGSNASPGFGSNSVTLQVSSYQSGCGVPVFTNL